VNISSIVAQVGVPGTGAYSASKSGILGLTRTLAAENASKGITVNALALGYFSIGMIRVLSPEMQELVLQKIPMHRLGDPRCLTAAIRFLIECDYMTGTVLNINGGLH
jgi:NAD(P)-dependent dehydrogenase (short-subunit alcohol dehydrogenase family)